MTINQPGLLISDSYKAELIAVDGGNYNVKIFDGIGTGKFCSAILDDYDKPIDQRYGNDDMIWQYEDAKGIGGTIADYEGDYGSGRIYGTSKNHFFGQMRVLLAIHKYILGDLVDLVIAQPFSNHGKEKNEMILALKREHRLIVDYGNGPIDKTFTIRNVTVVSEGAAAFYTNPLPGIVRIIDIGSGTVNAITFKNKIMVKDQSITLPFGTETKLDGDDVNIDSLAKGIYSELSRRWNKNDQVLVCGGAAKEIVEPLQIFFPNAKLLNPTFKGMDGKIHIAHSEFANVIGMYMIGRHIYGKK